LVGGQLLRLHDQSGQELHLDVAGLPEFEREGVVGLELLGDRADVAELDAELIVGCADFDVVYATGGVAERFELGEDLDDVYELYISHPRSRQAPRAASRNLGQRK
jgi:hypothetical protein